MRTTYSDPTANAVIAKITREEREKERREKQNDRRRPNDRHKQNNAPRKSDAPTAAPRYSEWAGLAG